MSLLPGYNLPGRPPARELTGDVGRRCVRSGLGAEAGWGEGQGGVGDVPEQDILLERAW